MTRGACAKKMALIFAYFFEGADTVGANALSLQPPRPPQIGQITAVSSVFPFANNPIYIYISVCVISQVRSEKTTRMTLYLPTMAASSNGLVPSDLPLCLGLVDHSCEMNDISSRWLVSRVVPPPVAVPLIDKNQRKQGKCF